jgi:hypothetical protein
MLWLQEGQRLLQGGCPASETVRERLQELEELWAKLQTNCQRKEAKLQEACEVKLCRQGAAGWGSGPSPWCPLTFCPAPQALRLQRSLEELGSQLEPMEVELRNPARGQDLHQVDELLRAQGELEAAVDRQTRQAQAVLGQAQAFTLEGCCLIKAVEEQALQLLHR